MQNSDVVDAIMVCPGCRVELTDDARCPRAGDAGICPHCIYCCYGHCNACGLGNAAGALFYCSVCSEVTHCDYAYCKNGGSRFCTADINPADHECWLYTQQMVLCCKCVKKNKTLPKNGGNDPHGGSPVKSEKYDDLPQLVDNETSSSAVRPVAPPPPRKKIVKRSEKREMSNDNNTSSPPCSSDASTSNTLRVKRKLDFSGSSNGKQAVQQKCFTLVCHLKPGANVQQFQELVCTPMHHQDGDYNIVLRWEKPDTGRGGGWPNLAAGNGSDQVLFFTLKPTVWAEQTIKKVTSDALLSHPLLKETCLKHIIGF